MTISRGKVSNLIVFFCSCLCVVLPIKAQSIEDTLANHSYHKLDQIIYENRQDSAKLVQLLNYYLRKAQKEDYKRELVNYYMNYVFYQAEENRLPFIDSALYYAHQVNDNALIGNVYLTKGIIYYTFKDYQQTLDHYLIANEYILQTDDVYNKYSIKNMIGGIKNYLGYYEEAEELFEECIDYFGQEKATYNMHRGYINSMLGLTWSYTKTDRIPESVQLLATALKSAKKMGFSELDVHYLEFKQGINEYYLGNYDRAIQTIEQKLPFLYENEDFAWVSMGEFYIGKSWWAQGEQKKALPYFDRMDELFRSQNYTHPDLREAYELMINYYRDLGNKDAQLNYITQLVKADNIFNQDHKYLINNIHKRYTTQELIRSKSRLEAALYIQKNKTKLILVLSGTVLLLVFAWIYYQRRKTKKIVQELIQKVKASQLQPESVPMAAVVPAGVTEKAPFQMKAEVVDRLLDRLNEFERDEHFLKSDITLEKLTERFETNTTYLSQIINIYKKQTFSQYLNTLRMDYLIHKLVVKDDPRFFNYSIESLAELVGYNSTSAFSRAFKNHTKVNLSDFINRINRIGA